MLESEAGVETDDREVQLVLYWVGTLKLLRSVTAEDDLDVRLARELLGVSDRLRLTVGSGSAALMLFLDLHMGFGESTRRP